MFGQKITPSLVLLMTIGVTIGRPGMGEHSLNSSIHPDKVDEDRLAAGSVCVPPIPKSTSGKISLANPTGGNRSFNYSIQIGSKRVDVSRNKGVKITGLPIGINNKVKIFRDGKPAESFQFSFEKKQSHKLCLWFNPLYETWSLWPASEGGKECQCKG
jgi:hypothetical protein